MSCQNKTGGEIRSIVIASSNPGKIRELQSLFGGHYLLRPQSDFGIESASEGGKSFIENAILKARHAAHHAKLPAIADDSGLEVDALQGRPGVFSARYAGIDATDAENVEKLLKELQDVPLSERAARFHCAIVFMRFADDPVPLIGEGTWHGYIQLQPSGENGFGYDPVFHVVTRQCSAAELDPNVKNQLSHRGQALKNLSAKLGHKFGFTNITVFSSAVADFEKSVPGEKPDV